MNGVKIFGISELNNRLKSLIESDADMAAVFVRGEISNYKAYPSGHHYFTLKDAESSLRCVMFKREASRMRFRPENGMSVIALGRISVFPRDGVYQLYCSQLEHEGDGDLNAKFEKSKEKLMAEGLFDEKHKKPLPRYPSVIAVVTSSAGAAVRDIIKILRKRFIAAKVLVLPVRVQGTEAPEEICEAIRYADKNKIADLIILGRGGGSREDLWAFNDENVARAIFNCSIPVISGVGHEPDVTIADYVADVRAATPSNAAEIAVPDSAELLSNFDILYMRMRTALKRRIDSSRRELRTLSESRVLRFPTGAVDERKMQLDLIQTKLCSAAAERISQVKERLLFLSASMDALSPLKVLGRGYSLASNKNGKIIKSIKDINVDEMIDLRVTDGVLLCRVEGEEYNGRKEEKL